MPIHLQKIDAKVQGTAGNVRAETTKRTAPFRKDLLTRLQPMDGYLERIYSAYPEKSGTPARSIWNTSLEESLGGFAKLIEHPPIDVQDEVIDSLRRYHTYVADKWDSGMRRLSMEERRQIYDRTKSLLGEARVAIDNWR